MAGDRSFKAYVASRFYNELYDAVSGYLEQNYSDLDVSSQLVRTIDSAELSDIEVKHVFIDDLPGMEIAFDVLLEAVFEISETDRHNDRHDEKTQWFKVSCTGDLSQDLDDFAISATEEYNYRGKQDNPMSDSLVPIIYKEQLEAVARAFLEEYYKEALYEPMAIDPTLLAERMRLLVQLKHITSDFSTFGQVFFRDCETEYYDKSSSSFQQIKVKSGTIFVDPDAYFLRNLGSVNNTIIHECVHWDKHRKAFELERLYNENATQIKCQVVGGIKGNGKDATDWMEWQANALAPRIQMPLSTFKTKAFEFIKRFRAEMGTSELIDVMEPVIDALAIFFCVSRISAKIRMIDAGYEEAVGTFTYIDGHYVKPHGFRKGSIRVNQTFSLSAQDAAVERIFNQELRALTDNGDYLFIDNHYVYNAPLYVQAGENGKLELTDYARSHMDECCLVFDMTVTSKVADKYHTECYLNREPSDITFEIKYHNGYQNAPQERQIAMRKKQQEEALEIRKQMTDDPEQCIELLLKWREMNYTDLGFEIDRDPKTISRTVKGETTPRVETAALICFGLHLPPIVSEKLMAVLQCSLNPLNPNHQWINEALHIKYPEPIWAVQDYLSQYGVEI
ncbi:ImmA/IrrE family metallo-endopeptidase [Syntrophomonas erecta]|jgi:hypothetical protein|nr:hypothetical protein [Desulfitobacteriaceae bacterium]